MKEQDLYESFYQPIKSVKKEAVIEPKVDIYRDEFGLTLECRKMLIHKLSQINVKDLTLMYPAMSDSIIGLYKSIVNTNEVKPVKELTFSEFWEQNKIGLIREQDKQSFSYCISLWYEMSEIQKTKVLSDFKSKYNRGIWISTILKDVIDPYWQAKKSDIPVESYKSDENSGNTPFFC